MKRLLILMLTIILALFLGGCSVMNNPESKLRRMAR